MSGISEIFKTLISVLLQIQMRVSPIYINNYNQCVVTVVKLIDHPRFPKLDAHT